MDIVVDYNQDAFNWNPNTGTISITFDNRFQNLTGSRWHTVNLFYHGTFSARIKCPKGDTSGLVFSFYLSSEESKKRSQDEIDFELLGNNKWGVHTNYFCNGIGLHERKHELGFDYSGDHHEYTIRWEEQAIEWLVDGKVIRRVEKRFGHGFPEKPMYLYASVWDGEHINFSWWAGKYRGSDAPYVCQYTDIKVPNLAGQVVRKYR